MAGIPAEEVVLMSIKPRWADAIMAGRKRVEFRRARFGRPVTHVIVYSSSPVQSVIGYFEVDGVTEDDPRALWREHAAEGEIEQPEFEAYYDGTDRGVAIHVGRVHKLADPVPLAWVVPSGVPPQSFIYARAGIIGEIAAWPTA